MSIVMCPGCSQRLRIPDNKRGTVACPRCSATWFYPEMIELSDVEFRCSSFNGARFNVVSSRRSPLQKFVIEKISKPGPGGPSVGAAESVSKNPAVEDVECPLPLAGPRSPGSLDERRYATPRYPCPVNQRVNARILLPRSSPAAWMNTTGVDFLAPIATLRALSAVEKATSLAMALLN